MKKEIISVSQLTNQIKKTLESQVGYVTVQGEISNFKHHSSGHRYFTLKDERAQISCTMWKSRQLSFQPTDGMKVILKGNISVYPPRGSYQIDCSSMVPLGKGDLFLAFEELKRNLEERGYFDPAIKKTIPQIPKSIGVITSPTGAAVQDIFSTIERRLPICEVFFRPAIVQGDSAKDDLARALGQMLQHPVDLIIIGRGGGSLEDLWAFNSLELAEAIFNSTVPIISAVGHETDFSISDFVADIRAATPTAAAEIATPVTIGNLFSIIEDQQDIMISGIDFAVNNLHDSIDNLIGDQSVKIIRDRIHLHNQRIDNLEFRISRDCKSHIQNRNNMIDLLETQIKSLHPGLPLKKGYSIIQSGNRIIPSGESLKKGAVYSLIREFDTSEVTVNNVLENK